MLLELGDHWIEHSLITCIKQADEETTSVWLVGQSAVDGAFLVDLPFDKVMELYQEACYQRAARRLAAGEQVMLSREE